MPGDHQPRCDLCQLKPVKKPGDLCRDCRKKARKINQPPGKGPK